MASITLKTLYCIVSLIGQKLHMMRNVVIFQADGLLHKKKCVWIRLSVAALIMGHAWLPTHANASPGGQGAIAKFRCVRGAVVTMEIGGFIETHILSFSSFTLFSEIIHNVNGNDCFFQIALIQILAHAKEGGRGTTVKWPSVLKNARTEVNALLPIHASAFSG